MIEIGRGDIHVWHARTFARGDVAAICERYTRGRCCIVRSSLGKPFVAGGAIEIGLSHTDGVALLAVSRRPVGIDAERIEPLPDLAAVARASLAPGEARGMDCRVTDRTAWFYRCWVRKEALLKARGCGLAVDPREVDTTETPSGWAWIDATLGGAIAVAIATPDPQAKVRWVALAGGDPIWHDACTKP